MANPSFSATQDSALLQACEQLARSPKFGAAAFLTYLVARTHTWAEARSRVSRSTWFQHLAVLRHAGVPTPAGDLVSPRHPRDRQPAGRYWFGAETPFEISNLLTERPGLVMQLINTRFVVSLPWRDKGPGGVSNRPVLEAWPEGTGGVVCSVIFDSGWYVEVEHDNPDLPDDERWPRVKLGDFLRHTKPEGGRS